MRSSKIVKPKIREKKQKALNTDDQNFAGMKRLQRIDRRYIEKGS